MANFDLGLRMGNRLAPPRFLLFLGLLAAGVAIGQSVLGWREGTMAGFDVAALGFLIACASLFGFEADDMRRAAERNDANRPLLLAITAAVVLVILVAVASELSQKDKPDDWSIALILVTLALAWLFSNLVYALHYAHMYYSRDVDDRDRDGNREEDAGGIGFPKTEEPDYWDFVYFAFTLGMTFQTSDTEIEQCSIRRVAIFHCFAAFVFNIGVLAFTINVLGGGK